MNWNHVWELFKINLLYANPQAVTNLQKRQEKKKKANFSIVNAMLRQQLLILVVFIGPMPGRCANASISRWMAPS